MYSTDTLTHYVQANMDWILAVMGIKVPFSVRMLNILILIWLWKAGKEVSLLFYLSKVINFWSITWEKVDKLRLQTHVMWVCDVHCGLYMYVRHTHLCRNLHVFSHHFCSKTGKKKYMAFKFFLYFYCIFCIFFSIIKKYFPWYFIGILSWYFLYIFSNFASAYKFACIFLVMFLYFFGIFCSKTGKRKYMAFSTDFQ